jgi:hypothetical protein
MKYADARVVFTPSNLEHLRQTIVRAQEEWDEANIK